MINLINRQLARFRSRVKDQLTGRQAQVGIVLVLVVAVALILYAAALNIGRVSVSKRATILAANTAASKMASFYASYGQMLFMESLGGKTKVCGWTGVVAAIITLIIIVIIIIISYACPPGGAAAAGAAAGGGLGAVAIVAAVVFAVANVVIQVALVQPGISAMWAKMMQDQFSMSDQVVEQGIQGAAMTAVSDIIQIPDLWDLDTDGSWGDLADPTDRYSAKDYVSRFAYYYTRRMQDVPALGLHEVEDYINALADLLYGGDFDLDPVTGDPNDTDDWGLYDPVDCSDPAETHPCCFPTLPTFPASCDPCCVPLMDPDDPTVRLRPECCDDGSCASAEPPMLAGDPETCLSRSIYNSAPDPYRYPYIYSNYTENSLNNFDELTGAPVPKYISFHEQIGRDDEHHQYKVDSTNANWDYALAARQLPEDPFPPDPLPPPVMDYFFIEDATRFYGYPAGSVIKEKKMGIFPFFYMMADWGVGLKTLSYLEEECHWCDPDILPAFACTMTLPTQLEPVLSLPVSTQAEMDNIDFSGTGCVDSSNASGEVGNPPLVADGVPRLDSVLTPDNLCAQAVGGWKRGADRFCSLEWPYADHCPKHGNGACNDFDDEGNVLPWDCACGESGSADAAFFPEDPLDEVVYGMPQFFEYAERIIALARDDMVKFKMNFDLWYRETAQWIESPCPVPPCAASTALDPDPDGGKFVYWRDNLLRFFTAVSEWITPPDGSKYVSDGCVVSTLNPEADNAFWCVPPARGSLNKYGLFECPGVNPDEVKTFDISSDGRGDLEDVIECLDWNVNDKLMDSFGNIITGNFMKFERCQEACDNNDPVNQNIFCAQLPRSLVPGLDEKEFQTLADPDLLQALIECAGVTSQPECWEKCTVLKGLTVTDPDGNVISFDYQDPSMTDPDGPSEPQVSPYDGISGVYGACDAGAVSLTNQCWGQMETVSCDSESDKFNCSCTYKDGLGTCGELCPGAESPFFDKIEQAISGVGLSCIETDPGGFKYLLDQAVTSSEIQVPKLAKRLAFLEMLKPEAEIVRDSLEVGVQKMTDFIEGPVQNLIDARKNYKDTKIPTESFMIYVWQDEEKEGNGEDFEPGMWHAVKVEVRVPGRCNEGLLGQSRPCVADQWPYITEYTRGFLKAKRCYALREDTGRVKVRVIRYDQGSEGEGIKFPSGQLLWLPRFGHPDVEGEENPTNLEVICANMIDPEIRAADWRWAPSGTHGGWKNAFMLNRVPLRVANKDLPGGTYRASPWYHNCWRAVHERVLMYGASTESCAMYYVAEATFLGMSGLGVPLTSGIPGFQVKFVNCDTLFTSGQN